MRGTFLVLLIIGLPIFLVGFMYNGFIRRRNAMRHAFASIEVQLKKRWDLVPGLVETTKGISNHEREMMESVTKARASRKSGDEVRDRLDHEADLGREIGRVMALAESYPELRSGENFLLLQRNLTEIESQLSAARRAYNSAVMEWNQGVESFPGNIVAEVFEFHPADYFEVGAVGEREAVDVKM